LHIPFEHSYARLPATFFSRVDPTPVRAPRLIAFNRALADELGLGSLGADADACARLFSGNAVPAQAQPLAMAYAGHQFGHFVPQLGDGRAILLGEVIDRAGRRRDIQLKGAGRTPYSRGGDGRSALGPVLREYLVSEAMHALDVPTTRALAAVSTGELVYRDEALPGAVLTRVANSHVRVGTFQYLAARGDYDAVGTLIDHLVSERLPEIPATDTPAQSLLAWLIDAQAALVAKWLQVGFIHGVMNTDNTSVTAETIDFGPCAFLDAYDPATVFSSIDHQGRYAYGRQPAIAQWNLTRFAECLLPLLDSDTDRATALATRLLERFPARFEYHWLNGMRAKLGLVAEQETDATLIQDLLQLMQSQAADFTRVWRGLADTLDDSAALDHEFSDTVALQAWLQRWWQRLGQERDDNAAVQRRLRARNPAFIPRNHLVERAIRAAVDEEDFTVFEQLRTVWARPFEDQPGHQALQDSPQAGERVMQTFCGT